MRSKKSKVKLQNSKVMRIMDVNINRGREGLRVVEELCRFVIEDEKLTLELKKLRGELARVIGGPSWSGGGAFLGERKAVEDVGRELYTKGERGRADFVSIFHANMKRAQEAVRCLEEFSKLIASKFGKKYKDIRFKLYDLEKRIALKLRRSYHGL